MNKAVRSALSVGALTVVLAFAGASTARGQVYFQGNFPVPHGRISVGVGGFPIDSFVPGPYVGQVYYRDGYGYGFDCDEGWIPVRRYANSWIVIGGPIVVRGYRPGYAYGYAAPRSGYSPDRYSRFRNRDESRFRRFSDRRDNRSRDGRRDSREGRRGDWRR